MLHLIYFTLISIVSSDLCCQRCSAQQILSCCDLCDPNRTMSMKPSDNFEKPPRNPMKFKVDEKRTPSAGDNELTQKLKIFHQDIHCEFIGSTNDSMIGPQVFLPNLLVKQLCNLTCIHVFQSLDDLSDNIQWCWLPKHGNALITIIHSVYPPQPVPTPDPPIAFYIQPCPAETISRGIFSAAKGT